MSKQKPQGWDEMGFTEERTERSERIFQSALTHPAALMDLNL